MSAYASDWPPSPSLVAPSPEQQSPVKRDANTHRQSSGGEEKKQSESDMMSSAEIPPRSTTMMEAAAARQPPKDAVDTSSGTNAPMALASADDGVSSQVGENDAAAHASELESTIATAATVEVKLSADIDDDDDDLDQLQASTSTESFVRVKNEAAATTAGALSSSSLTHTPPPPPADGHINENAAASRSPRERLVERLAPHRPAIPAGAEAGADVESKQEGVQGAVDLIHLQPREQQQQQPKPIHEVAPVASPASLGLSIPSPPPGGGLLSTPSRQGTGMMIPLPPSSSAGGLVQQQQHQPIPVTMRPDYNAMASNVSSYAQQQQQQQQPGRRCIRLRLVEEEHAIPSIPTSRDGTPKAAAEESTRRSGLLGRASILNSFRKKHRGRTMSDVTGAGTSASTDRVGSPLTVPPHGSLGPHKQESSGSIGSVLTQQIDRGYITVSWYDGTGSAELNEHVLRSVRRKLGLSEGITLQDVRIIDESVEPNEEIVLCPYIPDGSVFLLKFSLRDENAERRALEKERLREQEEEAEERRRRAYRAMESYISEAPESPSAAPSPHPSSLDLVQLRQILTASGLVAPTASPAAAGGGAKEIALAAAQNEGPAIPPLSGGLGEKAAPLGETTSIRLTQDETNGGAEKTVSFQSPVKRPGEKDTKEGDEGENKKDNNKGEGDKVQDVLRQLSELLGVEDGSDGNHRHRRRHRDRNEERKQVVFVLANYFVLFLSLIVISAEIHERAPRWMDWVNTHVDSVQSCSKDSDALYKCVSEGNLAGLVASFIFWITRSAATKNILLFGFDSPQKLWTVVYEALVSALCWGTSYIFIRRGLNPDTRRHFLHKYWKDAIYGSLAGFNAAFLKAVLKNLIPQDQVLDALETRQLRVVGWLSNVFRNEVEDF